MNQEEHHRIVNAAVDKFKLKHLADKEKRAFQELIDKAKVSTIHVHSTVLPIVQAGGFFSDRLALEEMIARLYLEEFTHYAKDELVALCSMLHQQLMMETIEADPRGTGKPDAIS